MISKSFLSWSNASQTVTWVSPVRCPQLLVTQLGEGSFTQVIINCKVFSATAAITGLATYFILLRREGPASAAAGLVSKSPAVADADLSLLCIANLTGVAGSQLYPSILSWILYKEILYEIVFPALEGELTAPMSLLHNLHL